jgi:hypothetical protein
MEHPEHIMVGQDQQVDGRARVALRERRDRTVIGDIERLCRRVIIIDQGRLIYDGTLAEIKRGLPQDVHEQVGGDVDVLAGKRATLAATPWKFQYGDACPVRFIGMIDPSGKCRIDSGK